LHEVEEVTISAGQLRAARGLLGWSQTDLAEAAKIGRATIADFESGKREPYVRTIDELRAALEAAGVEFTNGNRPGVRMKSYKLKDGGKNAFPVGPVAKWIGFGAVDDMGRLVTVQVEDTALERLDPSIIGGANHMSALDAYRDKIFKIAAEKYEVGLTEPGEIISVTDADVAQQLR
jgi:transcriptional regulator with XRE-family HTH domain